MYLFAARVEATDQVTGIEESIILAQIKNETLKNQNMLIKIDKGIRFLKKALKNKGK